MEEAEMTEDEIINNLREIDYPLFGSIESLTPKQQTDRVIKAGIAEFPFNYRFIKDESKKTDEVTLLTLARMGHNVYPEKTMEENLIPVIETDYKIFKDLPERLKNRYICEVAARQDFRNLPFIPPALLTEEMCLNAAQTIKPYSDGLYSLQTIPYSSVCLHILQEKGNFWGANNLIDFFSPDIIDADIAMEAIKQDVRCIASIPEQVKYDIDGITEQEKHDIRDLFKAFPKSSKQFNELPEERKTELVSLVAVSFHPYYLSFVPDIVRSDRVIEKAIQEDGNALLYLPKEERTDARQMLAINNIQRDSERLFEQFPDRLKTEEICIHAASICPAIIENVPDNLLTEKVCQASINAISDFNEEIEVLCLIPHHDVIFRNLDKLNGYYPAIQILRSLEPEQLDDKNISWFIPRDPYCFDFIPKEKITPEHCLLLEKCYPDYFKERPEKLPKEIRDGENIYTASLSPKYVDTRLNSDMKPAKGNISRDTLKEKGNKFKLR